MAWDWLGKEAGAWLALADGKGRRGSESSAGRGGLTRMREGDQAAIPAREMAGRICLLQMNRPGGWRWQSMRRH